MGLYDDKHKFLFEWKFKYFSGDLDLFMQFTFLKKVEGISKAVFFITYWISEQQSSWYCQHQEHSYLIIKHFKF